MKTRVILRREHPLTRREMLILMPEQADLPPPFTAVWIGSDGGAEKMYAHQREGIVIGLNRLFGSDGYELLDETSSPMAKIATSLREGTNPPIESNGGRIEVPEYSFTVDGVRSPPATAPGVGQVAKDAEAALERIPLDVDYSPAAVIERSRYAHEVLTLPVSVPVAELVKAEAREKVNTGSLEKLRHEWLLKAQRLEKTAKDLEEKLGRAATMRISTYRRRALDLRKCCKQVGDLLGIEDKQFARATEGVDDDE